MKLKKKKFYHYKTPILLEDVDIEKVLASNKISFGEKNYKYFIGYLYDNRKVKPLHIMLPKLEKYNIIWDKVSADIKKEFDSEPVYNKEYLKTKIKYHGDEVTDFYDKKIPKVDSSYTCLAVISWDSALKKDGNYYLQVFLKECKYIEKKVIRCIMDNLVSSSDDSDDFDEE